MRRASRKNPKDLAPTKKNPGSCAAQPPGPSMPRGWGGCLGGDCRAALLEPEICERSGVSRAGASSCREILPPPLRREPRLRQCGIRVALRGYSLRLDIGFRDDALVVVNHLVQERPERRATGADRKQSLCGKFWRHLGRLQRCQKPAGQLRECVRRGFCRCDDAVENFRIVVAQPGLAQRRHIGQRRNALGRRGDKPAQRAGLELRRPRSGSRQTPR